MYFKILIFIFLPLFMYSNEEKVNVGYYNNISSVQSYKNSKSALHIWVNDFTKNIYKNINIKIYDNNKDVINDYNNKLLDVMPIQSYNYLLNKEKLDENTIEYWHFQRSKIKPYQKMYLIVNKNSNINTIKDLKNKKVAIDSKNEFGKIFLEKVYLNTTKKNADDLMSKITDNKSNSLLLQTYFSKYDASVITSYEYDVMLELNPAIKKKIKILKSSPAIFPHVLILFNKNKISDDMNIFKQTFSNFFSSEEKYEFFNILEIKEFSIIKENDLDDLNKYYKNYLQLKNKFKK